MVKMRVSKDRNEKCICCNKGIEESLEIFNICFGDVIIAICDRCNDDLLTKSVRASCLVNHRVKSKHDLQVINNRNKKAMKEQKKYEI